MEINELKARFDQLVSLRKTMDSTWESIAQTMMPYRGQFFRDSTSEHEVDWRRPRHIYDSTAPMAIQTLSASLHGSLTSPAVKWFEMKFRHPELKGNKEAQVWLDNASEETYNALQDSNFNLEANEAYTDLVGFGTTVIIQEEEDQDTRAQDGDFAFTAIPPESLYFEQDHKGQCCRTYRKMMWTPLQMISKFGRDNVPEHIIKKAESPSQAAEKIMMIMAIYKRKGKPPESAVIAATERAYGLKYFLHESAEMIGVEGGYYEMPVFTPRWRKTADSMWGNSPAMMALPDVLTLNELTQMGLQSLEKVIDPATMATERGLLSNLDLSAGGLTIVRDKDSIWPYESRAKFQDIRQEKLDLKASIRSAFFVDQLELKDSPAMTATEVQVRYELMQRLLGPTLGRLENDFLSPLISRSFNILLRAGRFGEVPPEVAKLGVIDIKYVGPLARAQRKDTADSIIRWVGGLSQLAETLPEVMDIPDPDAIAHALAELEGVPANLSKAQPKINAERKAKREANADAQQADLNKTVSEGNKNQAEAQNLEQQ